ncbi:alpha/beta-hydrolase [Westerdykella ornata]|uniref:Carboxylic ester hydrolase n=1 Tax=Westerdykella ornata TaxID=318751 RepID=A0A6A6JHD1_WESOR|nr:alpha/beta-hydrolase [Westerdykella ornata]KAF2275056.1 alpha/beta-hydrolase [Westerdykella ornata]
MARQGRRWLCNALSIWTLLTTAISATSTAPQVKVRNGTYEGLHLASFNQDLFLGIPYAQDTGGQNRFRVPQSLNETWTGVREAKQYGHACPDHTPKDDAEFGMSENCLSINIVRPAGISPHAKLPIAVWIHGGSYQVGTSALPYYNLTYIVQRSVEIGKPIIGASINYRKGGWGMMYSIEIQGSGNTNLALRDMRKGLAWIQENIGGFGGDKDRVTIWGESAGSFAVGQLLLSYGGRTDNLFHRSIQESGSAATAWYNGTSWYQPIYDKLVRQTNCTSSPDTLACLRAVPYTTIYPFLDSSKVGGPGFYPTVDGDIIPNYPTEMLRAGHFAHVPHLYGTNSDEGTDNAPPGIINTDDDLYNYLVGSTGYDFPPSTVREIMRLYPDDPSLGIPLNTGDERFEDKGKQYKRAAAIIGDVFYHATRLDDARHYSAHAPTYIYRFNTRPWQNRTNETWTDFEGGLAPEYKGVQHFSEVQFVFGNPRFVGPWPEYQALSRTMSALWIHFVNQGDPNGEDLPVWPEYTGGGRKGYGRGFAGYGDDGVSGNGNGTEGGKKTVGWNLVLQAEGRGQNGSFVERDDWRLEGREYLIQWARRRHV